MNKLQWFFRNLFFKIIRNHVYEWRHPCKYCGEQWCENHQTPRYKYQKKGEKLLLEYRIMNGDE